MKSQDRVLIQTDTAVDREGVPVNVGFGSLGIVTEVDGMPQVLCLTSVGLDVVGIPESKLILREKESQ